MNRFGILLSISTCAATPWDLTSTEHAARLGHFAVFMFALHEGCPVSMRVVIEAGLGGSLQILTYLAVRPGRYCWTRFHFLQLLGWGGMRLRALGPFLGKMSSTPVTTLFAWARRVTGCHLNQGTRAQNALNDVAGNICQALRGGTRLSPQRTVL